ncbi:MAG: GNAT family N-acetyltransferase [Chloroflexota bacterium]
MEGLLDIKFQYQLTARLRLEPIGLHHVADLLHLHNDDGVAAWYGGGWTHAQAAAFAKTSEQAWQTEGVHEWMAFRKSDNALVGRGGLSWAEIDDKKQLEIGWALRRKFWGQGFASEIGRQGLHFAFSTVGAKAVVAYTEVHNVKSRAVMERLGMSYSKEIVAAGLVYGLEGVQEKAKFALYCLNAADWHRLAEA